MTGATSFAYDGPTLGHAAGRSSGHEPLLDDEESPLVHAAVEATDASDAATTANPMIRVARVLTGP